MIQHNLVGAGKEDLSHQEYFKAIQKFLLVKEHKLDLIDEIHCHGGVIAIEAVDIDNNTTKEVNIITTYGRCKIYSCGENLQKIVQLDNPSGFQELRFFKYGRGASTHSAMLVAYKKNAPPAIYHFSRQGNKLSADLRSIIGIPRQQEDDLEIYCIIYKDSHLYLAASNNKIYRFSPFSPNKPDQELDTLKNIQHFQIDDLPSPTDANTIQDSHLVGIMHGGGIIVYDINPHGYINMTPRSFAHSSLYICVQVADPDNEGSESIIACASNGKLDIYDLHTTQLKYSIKCADKFHSLYCDDIDNDGILEILVGGASNRIYVFAVDPDRRELRIKWEYPTEHRVTALWAGNIRQLDKKRVIAGLANGKLQVFKIYIGSTINKKIAQAFNDLKKSHGNKEILNWFSESKYPAVARYGMDVLEREMDCHQVVEFLQSIEEQQVYDVNLQILQKLGYLLKKYQNEKILIRYTFEFIERLYKKYQNLPTCEQICFELEKINNVIGSGNDFLGQFKEFTEEKIRWKDLPIRRSEDIKRLSSEGLFPDAYKQLDNLKLIGMDLLESHLRLENIEFISSIDGGNRIILASSEGDLYRIDKGRIDKKHFNDTEIHIVLIHGSKKQYFIGNGSDVFKLDSFDYLDMDKPFASYSKAICCLTALHHQGQDYLACGLVNNDIVIQAGNVQRREFTLPAIPIKMELKVAKDKITFYVITVTGCIYRMQNINDFLNQPETQADPFKQPWLELGDSVNVLDWVCIENEQGNPHFYVLTPDSIYSVHADGEKSRFCIINNIDRQLISIALGKTYKGSQEIIIGTRQRSLIFLSLEGEKTKELFLADMPTAVHSLANNGTGQEIIVALAQGLVNRYRVVSPNYLKELETICNQEKGYALLWAKHTLAEKMVLIALSLGGAELTGIHDKLHRIKHFFPKDNVLLGVQSLEALKLIVSHVEQKESHYLLQDSGYAHWISTHQDVFKTALEHRQELIAAIKLIDVCKIDVALNKEKQLPWVTDFLLINPEQWANLVHLSIALTPQSLQFCVEI